MENINTFNFNMKMTHLKAAPIVIAILQTAFDRGERSVCWADEGFRSCWE